MIEPPLTIDPPVTIEPSILCFGTSVVPIGTQNEDGTANLAPISSAWWIAGLISAFEVRVTRAHVHPDLLLDGRENRIDPAERQPLIMTFQKLYRVSGSEIVPSRLAEIAKKSYRMPDVDRARGTSSPSAEDRRP